MVKNKIDEKRFKKILNEFKIDAIDLKSGIKLFGDKKEKILEFINVNSNVFFSLNENELKMESEKITTLLDEEMLNQLKNKNSIGIMMSTDNIVVPDDEYIKVLVYDETRFIILNKKYYNIESGIKTLNDPHDNNIKTEINNLFSEELADLLIKSLYDKSIAKAPKMSKTSNNNPVIQSSTLTVATMAQNQTVYHGPHLTQYATVGSVDNGEQVYILSKAFGFYHIQYIVTNTGKQKQGYVPQTSIEDYTGPAPEEEDYYGGYCFATTELDVRTCDDFSLTAPVGTLYQHEGCSMLFHYNTGNYHVAYIEYSTSTGTKRGYVYNQYLSFPRETCVGVMQKRVEVYAGPNSNYASIGAGAASEFVSIIAKESDEVYIEYNTNGGRKRGYVKYSELTPYNRPSYFSDFYDNGSEGYIVDERVIVYGGPNSNYAQLGAVRNEDIISFNTNNSNNYTCVLASKVMSGSLPEENNDIETFSNS